MTRPPHLFTLLLSFTCMLATGLIACDDQEESSTNEPSVTIREEMDASMGGEPMMAGEPVMAGEPMMAGEPNLERVETTLSREGRMIPVVAYVPEGEERLPLVVFTPGFQLDSAAYEPLLERIAQAGFVVARLNPVGTPFDANHLEMGADATAVLDWALSGEVGARVNAERVARVGHSLGGKLSLLNASQDPRVRAVVALDPVDGDPSPLPDPTNRPTLAGGALTMVNVPVALIGELTNAESDNPFAPACAPLANNFQTIYEGLTASPWVLEWELVGADHMDFVYECPQGAFSPCALCAEGTLEASRVQTLTEGLTLDFLRLHLKGEADLEAGLLMPTYPEVRSRAR